MNDPILISSKDVIGFTEVKDRISAEACKILGNPVSVPTNYLNALETIAKRKELIWKETEIEPAILQFFHKIGEIVYFESAGRPAFTFFFI